MPSRHDWLGWESYLAAHTGNLRRFEHFIRIDAVEYTPSPEIVDWDGVYYCHRGIEIHVRKSQDVRIHNESHQVRTVEYSYQVLLRQPDDSTTPLFRYDNAAHHRHDTPHHKHTFRPDGAEIITHVGEDWPTLADVLDEAEAFDTAPYAREVDT